MPELPQMQALSERLGEVITGRVLERYVPLGFSGLKTVTPAPESVVGAKVEAVGRRGKYLVIAFDNAIRVMAHLSQAGRVDVETPAKETKPKGSVVRFVFDDGTGLLIREHGTQRKAGWWVVAPDDEGPLAGLGPEPDSAEFAELIRTGDSTRHLHTLLRDQRTVAGIGRGYADDALNRAGLSPFSSLRSLDDHERARLLESVQAILARGLELERQRRGGLSDAKLGTQFLVHNRAGQPCPVCDEPLLRVSFDSHEVDYCKRCQTKGKTLADRRLSRLLR